MDAERTNANLDTFKFFIELKRLSLGSSLYLQKCRLISKVNSILTDCPVFAQESLEDYAYIICKDSLHLK